ncbi:MAG: ABC transporter ATP-binding protein [Reyranella sp.]|nr:ABC transporter ATP-binding protein [Reyranella sp.]
MRFFAFFEGLIAPTAAPPDAPPPAGLVGFYMYFLRQVRGLVILLLVTGFVVAILDSSVPAFIGWIISLVSRGTPEEALIDAWPQLLGIAMVILVLRPASLLLQNFVTNQAMAPGLGNLVRWQSHWHLVRQNWTFFQNGLAGALANRVVQTGPCLRETVILTVNAVWYIVVYGGSAIALLASSDGRLALPVVCWFAGYALLLRHYVPRIRARSRHVSEVRSTLTGRVVDFYANILTVKLFSRHGAEDAAVRGTIDEHTDSYRQHLRLTSQFAFALSVLNAAMIVSAATLAVLLWSMKRIDVGTVAMTLPLTWQITNIAGWVAQQATAMFENLGAVEDGMSSIAAPQPVVNRVGAVDLHVSAGAISFDAVCFAYSPERPVLKGVTFSVGAGERVGLMGPSGIGKSTLVHLLLRLHEPDSGQILIDGQDIAGVTADSLRSNIAVVTQDTALLERSLRENIRFGRSDASDAEVEAAAARAMALDFIRDVVDWKGRRGFDAHVGERGIRLSAGQRQRIAIARALLKNAPILVLDEATSALDEATEAELQAEIDDLMKGRTVIAISHRPSTLARLDRLIALEEGRIVDAGRPRLSALE